MRKIDFYPLRPVTVDKDTWFYVERKGLCTVRQVKRTTDGKLVKCDLFYLPWSKLSRAVDKYRAIKRRKR